MTNPDYTTQDVPTWAANLDLMNAHKAVGDIGNPLLRLPLLNSLAMPIGVGSITFARADSSPSGVPAAYIDRYGVLQEVGIDVPRFEANGLLIEGPSTNLLPEADDFTDPAWSQIGTMTRTGGQTDPGGQTRAVLLDDTDIDADQAYIEDAPTIADDSLTRTASIFVKQGSAAVTGIAQFLLGGSAVNLHANINWATKTIDNGTIEGPIFGDFYRVKIPITNNSSGNTSWIFRIYPAGASAGVTGSVTAFRAQAEELPFATSPIATAGAPVTRSADSLILTYSGNIADKNVPQTWMADIDLLGVSDSFNQSIFNVTGETARNLLAVLQVGGFPHTNLGASGPSGLQQLVAGQDYRIAGRRDSAPEVTLWLDGVLTATHAAPGSTTGTGTEIVIAGSLYGHVRNLRIYEGALSDREMAVA